MQGGVGKSIVVVGNGMSTIGSGLGSQIDAFDEVARFNHFAIKGYEQDVGTKTTIMVMAQIKVNINNSSNTRLCPTLVCQHAAHTTRRKLDSASPRLGEMN